jgi:hypothetical protein
LLENKTKCDCHHDLSSLEIAHTDEHYQGPKENKNKNLVIDKKKEEQKQKQKKRET